MTYERTQKHSMKNKLHTLIPAEYRVQMTVLFLAHSLLIQKVQNIKEKLFHVVFCIYANDRVTLCLGSAGTQVACLQLGVNFSYLKASAFLLCFMRNYQAHLKSINLLDSNTHALLFGALCSCCSMLH